MTEIDRRVSFSKEKLTAFSSEEQGKGKLGVEALCSLSSLLFFLLQRVLVVKFSRAQVEEKIHSQGPFASRCRGQLPGQRRPAGGASGAEPGDARGAQRGLGPRVAGLPAGGVSAGAPSPAPSQLCSLPGLSMVP